MPLPLGNIIQHLPFQRGRASERINHRLEALLFITEILQRQRLTKCRKNELESTKKWTDSDPVRGVVRPERGGAKLPDLDPSGGDGTASGVVEEKNSGGAVYRLRWVNPRSDAGPPSLSESFDDRVIDLKF